MMRSVIVIINKRIWMYN